MPLFESVEKNVVGFNKPASHGHAPKRLSSESLSLKVQILCQYTDRNDMDSSHMKSLKEMLLTVAEKVTAYLTVRGAKCANERGTCKNMPLEHY